MTKTTKKRPNLILERYKFLGRKQRADENLDQFTTALRSLRITCEFANPEVVLQDQLLLKMKDDKIKQKLLDEAQPDDSSLHFQKALEMAKRYETSRNKSQQNISAYEAVMMFKEKTNVYNNTKRMFARNVWDHISPRNVQRMGKNVTCARK